MLSVRLLLFDRCRRRNRDVNPSLDLLAGGDGGGGDDGCSSRSRCGSGVRAGPGAGSSTIFGILSGTSSPSLNRSRSRIALTRTPDAVTALTSTDVKSPAPTLRSHHCSSAPTRDAAGGHLNTRNAVPSSTQYTRRHLRSLACIPGAVNSILRGITPAM